MRTFSVMYDHAFSKLVNHKIKHQATHKVGCQPGDCIWSFKFSSEVHMRGYGWVNILTLLPPRVDSKCIIYKDNKCI